MQDLSAVERAFRAKCQSGGLTFKRVTEEESDLHHFMINAKSPEKLPRRILLWWPEFDSYAEWMLGTRFELFRPIDGYDGAWSRQERCVECEIT